MQSLVDSKISADNANHIRSDEVENPHSNRQSDQEGNKFSSLEFIVEESKNENLVID